MSYLSGSPLYNYELAMELKRRGHRVTLCSEYEDNLHGADGHKLKENLEKAGILTMGIKTLDGLESNYDLMIASQNVSEKIMDRLLDTPVIYIVHSEYEYETPVPNRPQITNYVCIRYNILEHIVNEHNIPRDKCLVIYNGVDRERFKPVKKIKKNYYEVVVPCTLDTLRERFLNEVISTASEKRRIKIFGFDCGAKLTPNPYVTIHPDKFNIEEDIQQADEVAGILLGRVNLEAWSCGVKSTIYDPDTLEHQTFEPPIDFDQKHNIKNVVDKMLALTVNIDDVTVVIPHHNRIDKLCILLQDIAKIKNLVIRRGGTFAVNNNDGFSLVKTPYTLFLNDDSRLNNNIIRGMLRMMDKFDIVGVLMEEGCTGFNLVNGLLEQVNDSNQPIHYPSGACLMVKTEVLKKVGGFDENYKNGCEDIDLFLRLEKLGFKIGVYTGAKLPHKEGSSEGRYKYMNENILLFNKTWKNKCQIKESM